MTTADCANRTCPSLPLRPWSHGRLTTIMTRMAATLERDMGTVRPPRAPDVSDAVRRSTVLVIDESADTDIGSLVGRLDDVTGPVMILVTRHPPPQCVIGVGTGLEAAVMWNDCVSSHQHDIETTDERVRRITSNLTRAGAGPVARSDCLPTRHLFRSLRRREIDAVVRAIGDMRPDRIVIDDAHHLHGELRAQIAGLTEATAPQ